MSATSEAAADCIRSAEKISRGEVASPERSEKRAHQRYPFSQELHTVWVGVPGVSHKMVAMRSTDISMGGLSLMAKWMAYVGQRGVVRLCIPGREPAVVGVEAVHCHYAGEMQYVIGCRFDEMPEQLKNLRFVERNGEVRADW